MHSVFRLRNFRVSFRQNDASLYLNPLPFDCGWRKRVHGCNWSYQTHIAKRIRSIRMYSLVMLAAMTAGPDVPQDLLCPVTPSKYGNTFWSNHSFGDCCASAVRLGELLEQGLQLLPGQCAASAAGRAVALLHTGTSTNRILVRVGRAAAAMAAASAAATTGAAAAGRSATTRPTIRRSWAARPACRRHPTPVAWIRILAATR